MTKFNGYFIIWIKYQPEKEVKRIHSGEPVLQTDNCHSINKTKATKTKKFMFSVEVFILNGVILRTLYTWA